MKRNFKQWWLTIPPISTKQIIISQRIQKLHDKWRWKSMSWLGTGTNMWRG